ncbi:glycosyltransferase family 9 protein [Acidisphaera rubrifaciens]|uniref:Glycosyltransferase family 9 protein n=1 Tax=Acidisphaera rubrifaciens HS-AP3 TaxID=1231350 RepID=A0A0D6P2L0_9PROT|nr:glycosyltransferase family 9 protein [Acidisphaera rubrifaciens]GAN75902.1 hypothetical protein Asru_0020_05 [Acidisphaera rubrifaciens HS-AP3]
MRHLTHRLRARTAEVRATSGSSVKATAFAIGYVLTRLPLLPPLMLGPFRRHRQRRAEVRAITGSRRVPGHGQGRLAFRLTGGLGDVLVIARFMRDLHATCGPFMFDVFAPRPEIVTWAFVSVDGFGRAYHDIVFDEVIESYDAAFRINQFVVVHDNLLEWRDLMDRPALVKAIAAIIRFRPKIDVFVDRHPLMDNFLAQRAVFLNRTRADFLHLMADIRYGGDTLPLRIDEEAAGRAGLAGTPYITIGNGFDQDFIITQARATKCYPYFNEVIAQLRTSLPGVRFVQLGTKTSESLEAVDLNLVGRTSLSEAAGILAGALLHIDNEGGLVHLASCLGVTSAVVFGPTPADYFGYGGNVNISPVFCGGCWWIDPTWMDACPRHFDTARCMTTQTPGAVVARILAHLEEAGARAAVTNARPAVASLPAT